MSSDDNRWTENTWDMDRYRAYHSSGREDPEENEEIVIGSNASDTVYRKTTSLEDVTGCKEDRSENSGVGIGLASIVCILSLGYGAYRLIDYLGDKF